MLATLVISAITMIHPIIAGEKHTPESRKAG